MNRNRNRMLWLFYVRKHYENTPEAVSMQFRVRTESNQSPLVMESFCFRVFACAGVSFIRLSHV